MPYFGNDTLITAITADDIEAFVLKHTQRGVSNKTIWHYVVDIRALFNWALKHRLVKATPVNDADLSMIKNRKPKKAALDLNDIEFAASVLMGYDRVYFNFMRYTGLRMDEANRACWRDVDFENGWLEVRGTKTEGSADIIPLAPVLRVELESHRGNYPDSELIFPGRSYQTKGRQIYSRRRFFEMIQRKTAYVRYMENHPATAPMQAWRELKKDGYPGGVRLTAKDLRDVFGTVVMDNVRNADTDRRLMRHTSLQTTTKYMRLVKDRMQEAVKNLGANLGGKFLPQKTQKTLWIFRGILG